MHVSLQFSLVLQDWTGTRACTTLTTYCASLTLISIDVIMLLADAVHDTSSPHTELLLYCAPGRHSKKSVPKCFG
jgi:hypothetical protein